MHLTQCVKRVSLEQFIVQNPLLARRARFSRQTIFSLTNFDNTWVICSKLIKCNVFFSVFLHTWLWFESLYLFFFSCKNWKNKEKLLFNITLWAACVNRIKCAQVTGNTKKKEVFLIARMRKSGKRRREKKTIEVNIQ